ncbi:hypothetical protein D3C74_104930 [compost metagenome]
MVQVSLIILIVGKWESATSAYRREKNRVINLLAMIGKFKKRLTLAYFLLQIFW